MGKVVKSGEKLGIVSNSGEKWGNWGKVRKSGEKLEKVAGSEEKWWKVMKSGK